jgi:hypothetical protein
VEFGGEWDHGDILIFASNDDWSRYVNDGNDPNPYEFAVDDSNDDIPRESTLERMRHDDERRELKEISRLGEANTRQIILALSKV